MMSCKILLVFAFFHIGLTSSKDIEKYTNDLVAEIEGGLVEAEAIAKQMDLELVGEIIPDSNIFQFQRKNKIVKRSVNDAKESLQKHPNVKNMFKQKINKRVKRDLTERELSSREQCFVSTIETPTNPSKRCVFPFQYKNTLYQRCTSDHSTNGEQWCATSVSRDGSVIVGEWGDCDFANIECRVLPPEPSSRPVPPPESAPVALLDPSLTGPISPRKTLPAIEVRPKPLPLPPQQPRLPMGTRRLPATLDEFLLLLGPRRPPRPIVQDAREDEDSVPKDAMARFTDKEWPRQWYLNRGGDIDMNVEEAWDLGYSGKGVTVTILDDGVEWNHPDLKDNYVEAASYDINANDDDPFPRYDLFDTNKHGTRCAGQVSAQANNSVCSVGIAFNSGIGGVRMLDGTITDAVEARSLSLNPQSIDIYSASWGPDDDGQTVDGPGPLTRRALEEGATKGRNGLGSIYVWASGNGGKFQDNCNCDGYATSIYTLSVSSASENGNIPWYSEQCSSTLATTYSSGSSRQGERKVITTDLHGRCTSSHTGTSASSPMAAGIIALVLEANPSLTWRDIQHIVVRSAKQANLKAEDWITNGAGYNISHAFGFGLMDAGLMVKNAIKWKTVPEQQKCEVEFSEGDLNVGGKSEKELTLSVKNCENVKFLEHVHVMIDISSRSRRGEFTILLKSPSGTTSKLLAPRPLDNSISGFANFRTWPLMSTHTWGESPAGEWKLVIRNDGDRTAFVRGWKLILYGTTTDHNK